jgi:hypothetical protein
MLPAPTYSWEIRVLSYKIEQNVACLLVDNIDYQSNRVILTELVFKG